MKRIVVFMLLALMFCTACEDKPKSKSSSDGKETTPIPNTVVTPKPEQETTEGEVDISELENAKL